MFIYKTTHISGKYYIGRCSRKYSKSYLGSGRWVQSIKDKTTLTREILSTHTTFEELCVAEERVINEHINDPVCMNWNNKSVGFATGDLNPSKKNPNFLGKYHTKETKKKISDTKKRQYEEGKVIHPRLPASEKSKQKSREANSCQYKICFEDGTFIVIKNLLQYCKENGHNDIAFHKAMKNNKPYKGMTYIKLPK
jgi:23S rRNA-/tRNA-specific pseudouridylate synthase